MPIEAFDKIANLVSAFPQGGDPKAQGDDHIRGIKSSLQATFPDADRAFRIPRSRLLTTTTALALADENRTIECQTGGGNVSLSVPTGLAAGVSWMVNVVKSSADANFIVVTPPGGQLFNGVFSSIFIYTLFDPHRFVWNGTNWRHFYNGVPAGAVITFFSGGITPVGWAVCDGSTLSPSGNFPELVLARGSATLPNVANSIIRKC